MDDKPDFSATWKDLAKIKYRESPLSTVSISTVPGLVNFFVKMSKKGGLWNS